MEYEYFAKNQTVYLECLQDALPTKQKLKSVDNKCIFCKTAVESTFHLFFDCDYAKAVWNLQPMTVQGVPHNSASLKTSFLHKYKEWLAGDLNSISMELAATKCWFIWEERCLRVFEDKSRIPIQLALEISRHYEYWHPMTLNSLNQTQDRTIKPIPHWTFPMTNTFTLNCDASWLSENINAGFGFVLRNWTGTFKGAESGIFRSSTAEEAEALVLLQAAKWVKLHNIQHLVIEGDSRATIRYLQGKESTIQWRSIAILDEVKKLVEKIVSFFGFPVRRQTSKQSGRPIGKERKKK
ncbi:uncharacterized protein LOC113315998 [Papaver somniferum]|uniref:uncharacterized protein LOC113315998 n=1 Tax=Papaver somniferum TaxID=3469 RepID=UPI000E6FC102|nr:uncharacterized protein LOC113315998 [Papaver somniferum]